MGFLLAVDARSLGSRNAPGAFLYALRIHLWHQYKKSTFRWILYMDRMGFEPMTVRLRGVCSTS